MKDLVNKIAKKLTRVIKRVNVPIRNYYKTNHTRKALLSYVTEPFIIDTSNTHLNGRDAHMMAEALNEMGFIVDIFNFTDRRKINYSKYNLIVGFGEPLNNSFYSTCEAKRIYHATGSNPVTQSLRSIKRIIDVQKKKGEYITESGRIVDSIWFAQMTMSDAIFSLGNESIFKTYRSIFSGPIYHAPQNFYEFNATSTILEEEKDWDSARENFLFVTGPGMIHKGLDLLLEYFITRPDLHLHVLGRLDKEKRFAKAYSEELKAENIHVHGFISHGSEKYQEILSSCGYILSLSVSEGAASAVGIALANSKLVPLLTEETGSDNPHRIAIKEASISSLSKTIEKIEKLSNEELERIGYNVVSYYRNEHPSFKDNFKEAISRVIAK